MTWLPLWTTAAAAAPSEEVVGATDTCGPLRCKSGLCCDEDDGNRSDPPIFMAEAVVALSMLGYKSIDGPPTPPVVESAGAPVAS